MPREEARPKPGLMASLITPSWNQVVGSSRIGRGCGRWRREGATQSPQARSMWGTLLGSSSAAMPM